MIEKIKQLYTEWNVRRILKRDFSPDPETMNTTRRLFMAAAHLQTPQVRYPGLSFARVSLAVVAVIILLNGGAVIYADTTDVPVTHPLYQYKILAEEVKVRATPVEKRPELEIKLAERRVKELAQLPKTDVVVSASTTVAFEDANAKIKMKLKNNLKKHLDAVAETEKHEVEVATLATSTPAATTTPTKVQVKNKTLCTQATTTESLFSLLGNEKDNQEISRKIARVCGIELKTPPATTTATTTITATSTSSMSTSTDAVTSSKNDDKKEDSKKSNTNKGKNIPVIKKIIGD